MGVCICVCETEKERQMKREVGRTVWICVYPCKLYVHCNLTPINLTDSLIIITKCRCGKLKLGSPWLPVMWVIFLVEEIEVSLWYFFFFITIIDSFRKMHSTEIYLESCGEIRCRRRILKITLREKRDIRDDDIFLQLSYSTVLPTCFLNNELL